MVWEVGLLASERGPGGFPILPSHLCPDEGLQVEKEGTSDTDAVCACKEGLHCTSKECRRCVLHTSCGPGFGVKQMGKWPACPGKQLWVGEKSRD